MSKPTIKQIAQALDIHPSTVSRVLNPLTRHRIGDDMVARVLKAAQDLHYSPNRIAAALRTRRSGTIGVVVPDIGSPVFPPIVLGIENTLARHCYIPIVANAGGDKARQTFVVDQLLARQVDGLILATAERNDPVVAHCLEQGVPIVMVNRSDDAGRVSSVVGDNQQAMALAVRHLQALGHRRIGHIAGPASLSTGHEREAGFLQALAACGLSVAQCPVVRAPAYTEEAGRAACAGLLARRSRITAVVAANDFLALGCYAAVREAGGSCPDDLSVVGHNDMLLMHAVAPALTTIRIPFYEMGARAAALMLGALDGSATTTARTLLAPELVVRASTRAL
ncbi:LacI family DNA-binding transcriptional regulator [Cupriavidus oxalaticus]|nr:LacI family DNA-binding transcriptional regulator [Cupriavidus oxalaticus]QRQ85104.1 LacI family DNA-binding transcriptional regulator [Cupriavidus oxalaticus]QRQ90808.1 LacI family DNA-binding transcriptional regulator [Cupriavidus oxalaticus]WQD85335.1 LacI family DNA-binding transcriptional regulator [Cupriavidus oxalaticus]